MFYSVCVRTRTRLCVTKYQYHCLHTSEYIVKQFFLAKQSNKLKRPTGKLKGSSDFASQPLFGFERNRFHEVNAKHKQNGTPTEPHLEFISIRHSHTAAIRNRGNINETNDNSVYLNLSPFAQHPER